MFRRIEDIILTNQVNLKEMRAPEKCKLRSLRCSKLRAASSGPLLSLELAAASSELGACVAASFEARSLVAASLELGAYLLRGRSLLRAQSLLQQAPNSKLRSSKLACCELEGCCSKLRAASSRACVAASFGARSLLASRSELRACCSKLRSFPGLKTCCMKEMQAPEKLQSSEACVAASSE